MRKILSLLMISLMAVFNLSAKTLYLEPNNDWKTANARFAIYAFGSGEAWYDMAAVQGEDGLYQAAVDDKYPQVIFCRMNPAAAANEWSNKWNQTQDMKIEEGKNLCKISGWDNAGAWDVYEPAGQGGETGDGIKLTFTYYDSTTGDSSVKLNTVEGIFDAASQKYVDEVLVGTQVYAGRKYKEGNDSIFSNLKLGSSSAAAELKFSLAEPTEVDSIVFRAAMYAAAEGGDGFSVNGTAFTLSAGKLIFEDKVWKPEGEVSTIDIVQTKASKGRFFLTSITIYPKSGETPEPPAQPKFYITGDSALLADAAADATLAWNPAAIKSMETSYKLNLKANQAYKLKVTLDGTWGEGKVKGFADLTTTADGLTADGDGNICFSLNTAGEVNVHYDGEFFFLNGDFYVAPAPEKKYYLKNNWNGGDWAWKEMTKEDGYYALENVVFGGTGVNLNTAESDEGATWIEAKDIEAFDAAYDPATLGALDTVVFYFDPEAVNQYTGANGLTALIIGKYIPAPVAAFYITGDSALVADAAADATLAWNPAAIKSMEISYKLNLKADQEYKLKVTLDGTFAEGKVKGFSDLTTTADGLSADADNNICFKLNTAGEVNVHYDGEFFFLNGDFYVAPAPEKKYYLKNNWNGGDWAWKEMTKEDGYYALENVVFGGSGVNLNTAESDEGATWIEAKDIEAFDAAYDPATLGALDTVVFYFDPEAVNQYTGANGLTALIIGKYIPAPVAAFYITGDSALVADAAADATLAWNPAAIESMETSYKLNLKANQEYKLKVTLDGTFATAKGFSDLTTTADGLSADADNNICFKLNTAGEVNVHYDGEFFFLNGDFYVAPAPEKKYYLKNNWNGGDWAWKEMTKEDGYYALENVVFGGSGVNLNTAESDEGATWIEAKDIEAFDAAYDPATLGALDTVVFYFDPEAVNQYTGANGLTALIIGKYAPAPAEHTYTVAGGSDVLFGTTWTPANTANDMVLVEGIYTWEKTELTLAAGIIEFKVCEDHAWTTAYPAQNYQLNIPEAGIYTVTITFNAETKEVAAVATKTGSAVVVPTVAMHGNFLGSWADTENFAIAEGNATASLTLNIEAGDYEFGMRIGGSGNWTANGVSFTRENPSAVIVAGSGNLKLAADKAGDYTFTWTYETNTLAITFPNGSGTGVDNAVVDVKAVKVIRDNQILIIKGDKTFNIQGQLVK